jgi:hypothetical protein
MSFPAPLSFGLWPGYSVQLYKLTFVQNFCLPLLLTHILKTVLEHLILNHAVISISIIASESRASLMLQRRR